MAETRVVVRLVAGTPVRADTLCTRCWTPSVFTISLYSLSPAGVSTVGTWTGCVDCGKEFK